MRSAVLALALLSACAPALRTASGEACRRTSEVYLDPSFGADEREDVARAVGAWTRALRGRECFALTDSYGGADVRILRAATEADVADHFAGSIAGLWVPERSRIWLVTYGRTDTEKATTAAHEIGHYLGLSHRNEKPGTSIVNAVLSDDYQLTEDGEIPASDVRAYLELTGQ